MIIGIDLGTTNSLVSVWREEKCELIPNNLGEFLTPSVVSIDDECEILVGRIAKERLVSHPDKTMAGFKRFMGSSKKFKLGKNEYTPSELSSFILKKLKQDAEMYLGETVEEAVISVPAYFNDYQRSATKIAGQLAGLKVERLVNEPSAASLAKRFYNQNEDRLFLVFDFGGGTLDISIVDAFDTVIEIEAVAGNNYLGGDDFNQVIAEYFCKVHSFNLEKLLLQERESILVQAENCKRQLTYKDEGLMEVVVAGEIYSITISNQKLIEIASGLLKKIEEPLHRVLNDSGLDLDDIEDVIMVGGSSKMPIVQDYLKYITKKELICDMDPDTLVAVGTGIYAGIKARMQDVRDILLTDICPFTLGTGIVNNMGREGDKMSPIIERNTVLPVSRERTYTTIYDSQKNVDFKIYQGEHRLVEENLCLGNLEVKVPPNKAGKEFIKVRFTYDINGILEVDAKVLSTNEIYNKLIINKEIKMSEAEINSRREALQKLKIHPKDEEKNKLLLARGERLYEENLGEVRFVIDNTITDFVRVLEMQELSLIREKVIRTEKIFDIIEKTPKNRIMMELERFFINESNY